VNLLRPNEWRWPTDFRQFMGWMFAFTCLVDSITFVRTVPAAIHLPYALSLRDRLLYAPVFPAVFAAISGVAWWTIWKGKPSARWWGVAASLMWILTFLRPFIIVLPPVWGRHAGALFVGGIGLLTFLWYGKERIPNGGKSLVGWFYERDAPEDIFKKR
jgi:hypothetical protein